jgi:hypothetical protein
MFTFLLLMCTRVHYGTQCLPPIEFRTLEACQFAKKHYLELSVDNYYGTGEVALAQARCIGIPKAKR